MCEHIRTQRLVMLLLLLGALFGSPSAALTQGESAYDLINAVNGLRALHGLQPYTVDAWLMAYAQEHSEYQAATKMGTHIHSDGTRPLDLGLQENVAGGTVGVVTVDVVVYQIWVDWGHRHILTGYKTGEIGAGVALSDDGMLYYTVDIRTGEELPATEAPFVGLQTSTPGADGAIIHVVGEGQTLWSIAVSYGVTIDDIRRLNGLAADSVEIFPGQQLLIPTARATMPVVSDETPSMTTEPSTPTAAPITATVSSTGPVVPSPSFTLVPATTQSAVSEKRASTGVLVALAIGILGLSIAAIFGFWPTHDDKTTDARK